ncbi:2,3-butanediol dehydrogenase [Actinomadura nitritigenes]|uniref:Alcohol dehydrogenase catalytic domain-containing protein n=1 Tax=Actinomadura nitritigenes TaxID=134602 RepID=A0ABS3RFE3_9ACTN|nr:alcohol dehydrogenase catalytic domain-containing protein [Actinomadura nitritigenes]MBO2444957.1 alcohol dehydrogenase catalytic domain-containing protein [Actinomadura nitritigenes]
MKALRWHGPRDLRLEDVPEPGPPGPGEALIEVAYCGVCGTDVHEYASGPHMIRPGPHPLTGHRPPLALGHEMSGTVLALDAPVPGIAVGDRVAVDPCWRCGECRWCRRGEYHICPKGGSVGLASPGGFAERALVPAAGLVRLPDGVPDDLAALAEPLAVGLHAVRRGGVGPGDHVLVLGAGPIGMAAVLAAKTAGAAGIYVSEPVAARREAITDLVTEAYDPGAADVRREVYLRTGRVGPDVVLEATGIPELAVAAVNSARRGGRIVLAGIGDRPAQLNLTALTFYERTLAGSLGYAFDVGRIVDLMSGGALDPSRMITGRFPLSEGPGLFADLADGRGGHLKALLTTKAS